MIFGDHPVLGRPCGNDGPPNPRIMIVGEAPGEREIITGKPFTGASGHELDRMLAEAGISRTECLLTNVCPWRPPGNDIEAFTHARKFPDAEQSDWTAFDGRWISPEVRIGLERLESLISLAKPKVIIALGNLALWALTRNWGVGSWRGSTLEYRRDPTVIVVPAHHPSTILRQWSWRIFNIWDFKRAKRAAWEGVVRPDYDFIIRPTFEQASLSLARILDQLARGPMPLACDIETRAAHMACVGFAWSKTEALCIPLMAKGHADYSYWTLEEETCLVAQMREILAHPNARIYGQNFSYDAQYFWRYWKVVPRLGLDTLLASHVLFPGLEKSLDVLSSFYCDYHVYWKDDGKEWAVRMDEAILWQYNCMDCVRTFEIAENIQGLVSRSGLENQLVFLHKVWHLTLDAMIDGIRVDHENKAELSAHLDEEAEARLKWIEDILGFAVNPKSPKQMSELFYQIFKQRPVLHPVTKKPTCNDEAISRMAEREPLLKPLAQRIQEFRSISVFKSTFVDAPVDVDGRMRTLYKPAGTETFRLSSSENAFGSGLNMQNIPKGDDGLNLPNIRKIFLPDPGYEIADMDLSSADLYIVVWESDETTYKQLLREGKDPYTEIAKTYYSDSEITKKDPRRQRFKSLAHGTHYLGKPRGMAQKLGLAEAEVARVQSWYYGRFPRIKLWQDRILTSLHGTRSVKNIWGFRRVYFDRLEGTIANQAVAWIGQSTVAILINKIWENIADSEAARDLGIKVSLQVHDSLVFQYPVRHAEEARKAILQLSRVTVPYPNDPLVIPVGLKWSTSSWGDCE